MDTKLDSVQLAAELRAVGLRVTAPRLATLTAVHEHQHADADSLCAVVRQQLGTVSKQAVYDILHALSDAGLIRPVIAGGRSVRYEVDHADNHHHMLCTQCGRLEDVACELGSAPCLSPTDDHGFQLEVAEVLFKGLCADCRQAHDSAVAQA